MKIIDYISFVSVPIIILIIVMYGLLEKKKVYDDFLNGAMEGLKIIYKIFPSLIGIFIAVGLLRSSGILDLIIKIISPITNYLKIPSEIMPLVLVRPVSGSASMAVATDIMNKYGVDSKIGLISATIMGSTETTLYVIALYTANTKVKNTKFILYSALIADAVGILVSIIIWNIFI